LGLEIDQSISGTVTVKQTEYIDSLLKEENITKISRTPASRTLHEVNPDAAPTMQSKYAATLAKLSWLSIQTRPDLRLICSYLATKTKNPSVDDNHKLQKALKYLNGTRSLGLTVAWSRRVNNKV
jgi:hypothetical protein